MVRLPACEEIKDYPRNSGVVFDFIEAALML
jgi:hypothetical protein